MNTSVWLISFTDSSGKKVQTVHTHNCISDFRMLDPNATVQAIDCAAVAELIEAASPVCMALHASRMIMSDKESRDFAGEICDRLKAAIANVGGAK